MYVANTGDHERNLSNERKLPDEILFTGKSADIILVKCSFYDVLVHYTLYAANRYATFLSSSNNTQQPEQHQQYDKPVIT